MFEEVGIGLETIEYSILRNKYGVRKPSELFNPRLVSVLDFPGLPFNSVYHYIGTGTGDVGPNYDSLLLRKYTIPAMVDHILEYDSNKGNPRKVASNLVSISREYHRRNFKMRPLKKWASVVNDRRTPIVVNYAIAAYGVRYINNFLTGYNRWYNKMHTVWNKVNELATVYNRQHFIIMDLPSVFPSIQDLKRAENMLVEDKIPDHRDRIGNEEYESFSLSELSDGLMFEGSMGIESFKESLEHLRSEQANVSLESHLENIGLEAMSRPVLKIFSSDEALNFMDFWIWAGSNRSSSLMSLLSPAALDKVNFIFLESGKISILNLGMFDKVIAKSDDIKNGQVKPFQAQRLLFRYLDKIFSLRTQVGEFDINDADTEEEVDDNEKEPQVIDKDGELVNEIQDFSFDDSEDLITDEMIDSLNKEVEDITPSLIEEKAQEAKALQTNNLTAEALAKLKQSEMSLTEIVKEQINELAESGAISAQEYRRLETLSESYKKLANPYTGLGSLEEFITIPKELEMLPEDCTLPFTPVGVLDKSILGNTLQTMQKQYLTKVMPRHVSSCIVTALQKQGVTIQSYRVEPTRTLFDEFDTHVISVVPTKGAPSTIRLKIPHVNEEGYYIANGIKNRLNPQRGDFNPNDMI